MISLNKAWFLLQVTAFVGFLVISVYRHQAYAGPAGCGCALSWAPEAPGCYINFPPTADGLKCRCRRGFWSFLVPHCVGQAIPCSAGENCPALCATKECCILAGGDCKGYN